MSKQVPRADDADDAYEWLFDNAQLQGTESEFLGLAEGYLKRSTSPDAIKQLAQEVRTIGLAQLGRFDDALAAFEDSLNSASMQRPDPSIDLAILLVAEMQLGSETAAARKVYIALDRKFFLSDYVSKFCENRQSRLTLAGGPAPAFTVTDLKGEAASLKDFQGKVVLVDFWATNCEPCLAEFPALASLYSDVHNQGFEIVGISLDDDQSVVEQFLSQTPLPWRIALSKADDGRTRGQYRVETIPATYLIDRTGKVAYVDLRGRDLERAVEQLLSSDQ